MCFAPKTLKTGYGPGCCTAGIFELVVRVEAW